MTADARVTARIWQAREGLPHLELAVLGAIALLTYTAAERMELSGIMALFVGGATT